MSDKRRLFERFAEWTVVQTGRPSAFIWSVAVVALWGLSGPAFGFNDTWQLIINTSTTVITFWMVFVIQHAQNKDTRAVELKLDELIRALAGTNESLIGIEHRPEDEIEQASDKQKVSSSHQGDR